MQNADNHLSQQNAGVTLTGKINKYAFTNGEPIIVNLTLKNESVEEILFSESVPEYF